MPRSTARKKVLCFESYRRSREARRARMLADVESPAPLRAPATGASLSERQQSHRRVMLRHLEGA